MKASEASAKISRKEPQLISHVCYSCYIDELWYTCQVEFPDLVQPFYFTVNKAKVLTAKDNQNHTDGE